MLMSTAGIEPIPSAYKTDLLFTTPTRSQLLVGVVDSRSVLQADGLEFNPRWRHEHHKLIY